jgi:hypothetical protein
LNFSDHMVSIDIEFDSPVILVLHISSSPSPHRREKSLALNDWISLKESKIQTERTCRRTTYNYFNIAQALPPTSFGSNQ